MRDLFAAAFEIQTFLEKMEWKFCFIGGLAVLRWGQLRTTRDVDLTLFTGFGGEAEIVDKLLDHFKGRREDTRAFALTYRVLLLASSNNVPIDLSLGGLPFEEDLIARSSLYEYEPGCLIRTCAAEDLVVLKAFAARDQDWADVRAILERNPAVDLDYVHTALTPLVELKEEPEILEKLDSIIGLKKNS